jgi:transcriptional regulator with XRE-family HTH domain
MNNNVGLRIKDTRERKNISQDAMAMELEITQSNYGRLEKSDSRLTVPKLLKIAEVLEVTILRIPLIFRMSYKLIKKSN